MAKADWAAIQLNPEAFSAVPDCLPLFRMTLKCSLFFMVSWSLVPSLHPVDWLFLLPVSGFLPPPLTFKYVDHKALCSIMAVTFITMLVRKG